MTHKEILAKTGIPLEALRRLQADGIIGEEVAPEDMAWFVVAGHIWGKRSYLEIQMKGMSKYRKENLLKEKKETPLEKWVMTRYMNRKPGERLDTNEVALELTKHFNVKFNNSLIRKIEKIRSRAYSRQRYIRQKEY